MLCISSEGKTVFIISIFFDQNTNQYKRISTGTKSKREAQTFLKNFNPSFEKQKKLIDHSKFQDEYIEYATQNKTLKYVKSIKLSFRHLIKYLKDIPLQNLTRRVLDQFIAERFSTAPWSVLM